MNPDCLKLYRDVSTFIAALGEPNSNARLPLVTPKSKSQYVNEGNSYYKMKRFELALAAYNHALALDYCYALADNNTGSST